MKEIKNNSDKNIKIRVPTFDMRSSTIVEINEKKAYEILNAFLCVENNITGGVHFKNGVSIVKEQV
jgi:hypothetical protein